MFPVTKSMCLTILTSYNHSDSVFSLKGYSFVTPNYQGYSENVGRVAYDCVQSHKQ